ncbi:hypothetical protein ACKUFS_10550 [Pseudomonas cannabina]|uniref:Uncharacterized protein n=3 Tax=Pseudomonas syringae group TaxID=136849 RepID=A0A3M3S049_PSECA|nr:MULTISPECIES: hypothetical protein [Pseudomonas syringae group]KPW18914.1 hypothetical protein ALO83_103543 [Pseudomonas cannabina pv. alisalensis]MBM0140221.1 hypothetical protein [Pseudomonas cannabina pv. alisalensis]QHE97014.1 hypothetical protein PMA4326_010530 [Pseudomonas syringae pv. maculicola str. ES4326]QQN19941.1 hypothetical protein JGS08_14930 [Pseudomonas cannabina pv. alisalensis]RMN78252.1 hypothetical protein ALQ53_103316 [Pseudomonas cannabina]
MESSQEVYVEWHIISSSIGRCGLKQLTRTGKKLLLVLLAISEGLEIELSFDLKDVLGLKVANDSYTWRSDAERVRAPGCSTFKVDSSKYIQWFEAETYGAGDLAGAVHYAFLMEEESIDIVSFNEPDIMIRKYPT